MKGVQTVSISYFHTHAHKVFLQLTVFCACPHPTCSPKECNMSGHLDIRLLVLKPEKCRVYFGYEPLNQLRDTKEERT